jgi:hypothetical protein
MRIIGQERCIRQLSILSARLLVDADAQAFFMDTNQSFLNDWVKNCCLHIPIFGVQMLSNNAYNQQNNRNNREIMKNNRV